MHALRHCLVPAFALFLTGTSAPAQRSWTKQDTVGVYNWAYDSHRGVVVAVAPEPNPTSGLPDRTWESRGSRWQQVVPTNELGFRTTNGFGFAHDAARKNLVLLGSSRGSALPGETHLFDGIGWTQAFPATSPPGRHNSPLVYDAARQRILVFGGVDPRRSTTSLADTWEWDGTNWAQHFPTLVPPARQNHALAYDPVRQQVVMFGGSRSTLGDTWLWDGATWVEHQGLPKPPNGLATAAFDPVSQRVIMVVRAARTETWSWDGKSWHHLTTGGVVGAGVGNLIYDGTRSRLRRVASEGFVEWTGTAWTFVQSFPAFNRTPFGGLIYDKSRDRTVGVTGGSTWEWDGSIWNLAAKTAPWTTGWEAFCYDEARQEGVYVLTDRSALMQTWLWDGSWARSPHATTPPVVQRREHCI